MLKQRSTTDILILMIAATICLVVIATVVSIAFVEIKSNGSANTSSGSIAVANVINTLIGLMAGFLAGRTETTRQSKKANESGQSDDEES
jgi:predicted Na+-dependent transporter